MHSLVNIYGLPNVLCNIAIYADNATLYSNFGWASDIWRQLSWLQNCNLILQRKTWLVSIYLSNNSGVSDFKMDGIESPFKILGLIFTFKLNLCPILSLFLFFMFINLLSQFDAILLSYLSWCSQFLLGYTELAAEPRLLALHLLLSC